MSSAVSIVLNRNFQAIDTESWEESISKLFQGEAMAVDSDLNTYDFKDWCELSKMMDEHPNGFVHSSTLKIAIPEAIRLNTFDGVPHVDVVFTRRNVLEHYNYRCCYCGKKFKPADLNYDHILPQSRGGVSNWTNIVPSCYPCNTRKANRTPQEAGMRMFYQPSTPKHHSVQRRILLSLPIKSRITWQRLIDKAYWDSELEE
jgi:5-methylcytosine-specific restriction endonuclease McrA